MNGDDIESDEDEGLREHFHLCFNGLVKSALSLSVEECLALLALL